MFVMIEKKDFGILFFLIVFIALALFLYFLPSQYLPENERLDEVSEIKPGINIGEVVSTVTSEKPEQAIAMFDAQSIEKEGTELTVYNQNLALVKEIRKISLEQGLNLVNYEDIASSIIADSVLFTNLSDPEAFVVEQNYGYDLVSTEKILERYLGNIITVQAADGNVFTGRLLSHSKGAVVLEKEGRIISINETVRLEFPELPQGLLTKPSLIWKLYASQAGAHLTETSYLTRNISWEASYVATVTSDDSEAELTGWVTIDNKSGTAYPNASLKLVAGELHTAAKDDIYRYEYAYATPSPTQFTEEALFEYYMYSLERKTDVMNNETKQISLLKASEVPLEKEFVFEETHSYYLSSDTHGRVKTMLSFDNSQQNNLGMPLPEGIVRVYKEDSEGKLQFIGEDSIRHTPRNEKVRLFLGYAFDIVADKRTVSDESIGERCRRLSYEVSIRNHKDEDITVTAVEKSWGDVSLDRASHDYRERDAYTFEFFVPVKANSESNLSYTLTRC